MDTDKYLTLISETHNVDNYTVRFTEPLTFGEDWEVALVQAYLPHRDSHFQESFKKYFPNNKAIGQLAVHYNTSPTATTSTSTSSNCTYQRHCRWDNQGNDEIGRVEDDLYGGLEQNHARTQNRRVRDGGVP